MSVFQLVYISAESGPMTDVDLEQILTAARRNNRVIGVTGMLLYDEGSFIQALEGDEDTVEALFERIEMDPRHHDANVLMRGCAEQRDFPDWSMGFHDTSVGVLPGQNDFLRRGFSRDAMDLTVVHKAFEFFREGHWRQADVSRF